MPTITKEASDQLVSYMVRHKCWVTPEEAAEWLKTEEGQRIHAMIEALKKERAQAKANRKAGATTV